MRRLAWIAAALAVGCGETPRSEAGPLDRLYLPTGVAVHAGRILVASSNGDLAFDDETGGSLLALDPSSDPAVLAGALNVRSFGGDLAVADPATCPGLAAPVAAFATRGSNHLYAAAIEPDGSLRCDGCSVPLSGPFTDPLAVGFACRGGRARAFVGFLRSVSSAGWIAEYDLADRTLRSMQVGPGPVRAFAYDEDADRLFLAGLTTSSATPLRWVELRGCTVGAPAAQGGCSVGEAFVQGVPAGVELRSMALAPRRDGEPRRAYLTGRLYDVPASVAAGGRVGDFGGLLLVVDLVESSRGGVTPRLVRAIDIGRGAQDVRVLPRDPARGDLVAALTIDDAVLWLYDDETLSLTPFGRDPATGAPIAGGRDPRTGAPVLGREPYGLAVDPQVVASTARIYVGSYRESFVTPIDVPLDAPQDARFTGAGGAARRITGGRAP